MFNDGSRKKAPPIVSSTATRVTPFSKYDSEARSAKSVKQAKSHAQLSSILRGAQAESLVDVDEIVNHSQLAGGKRSRKPGKKPMEIETQYQYKTGDLSQHNTSVAGDEAEISQYQEEGNNVCNSKSKTLYSYTIPTSNSVSPMGLKHIKAPKHVEHDNGYRNMLQLQQK